MKNNSFVLSELEKKALRENYGRSLQDTGLSPIARFYAPKEGRSWYLVDLCPNNISYALVCHANTIEIGYVSLEEFVSSCNDKGEIKKDTNFCHKGFHFLDWYAVLSFYQKYKK